MHPLFDAERYLADHPAAAAHPDRPLGHYRQTGAAAGARVNSWYEPDPQREPTGIEARCTARSGDDDRRWRDRLAARRRSGDHGTPRPRRFASEVIGSRPRSSWSRSTPTPPGPIRPERPGADHDELGTARRRASGPWTPLCCPDDRGSASSGRHPPLGRPNLALAAATGTHVAWMTAGDAWFPGRLSSVHRALVDSGAAGRTTAPDGSWQAAAALGVPPDQRTPCSPALSATSAP